MKTFVFPFYISLGKLDSVSCEIEFELSDKDARRLEQSAKEGGRFRLNEDEDIEDIYYRVYDAIIDSEREGLKANPTIFQDTLNGDDDDSDDQDDLGDQDDQDELDEQIDSYLEDLNIGINYPEDLQYL